LPAGGLLTMAVGEGERPADVARLREAVGSGEPTGRFGILSPAATDVRRLALRTAPHRLDALRDTAIVRGALNADRTDEGVFVMRGETGGITAGGVGFIVEVFVDRPLRSADRLPF